MAKPNRQHYLSTTLLVVALVISAQTAIATPSQGLVAIQGSVSSPTLGVFGKIGTLSETSSINDKELLLVRTNTLIPIQGRVMNVSTGLPFSGSTVQVCINDVGASACNTTTSNNDGFFSMKILFSLEDPHSQHFMTVTVDGNPVISNQVFYPGGGPQGNLTVNGMLQVTEQASVQGQLLCLQNGTNCPAFGGPTPTLQNVTDVGATTTNAVTFNNNVTINAQLTEINSDMILRGDSFIYKTAVDPNPVLTLRQDTPGANIFNIQNESGLTVATVNNRGTFNTLGNISVAGGSLKVNNTEVCRADGTNCPAGSSPQNLQNVTDLGATTINNITIDSDGDGNTRVGGSLQVQRLLDLDWNSFQRNPASNPVGAAAIIRDDSGSDLIRGQNASGDTVFWVRHNGTIQTIGNLSVFGGSAKVQGQEVCLQNGTNCPSLGGSTPNLQEVTDMGAATTNAVTVTNSVAANALRITGNTSIGSATASASGLYSIAQGEGSLATANYARAFGFQSNATGQDSTAIGQQVVASGIDSVALGRATRAAGDFALAAGRLSNASSTSAIALGESASASGLFSFAAGNNARASGANSQAIGQNAQATTDNAVALGSNVIANASNSLALGTGITVNAAQSVGIGLSVGGSPPVTQGNTLAIMGGNVGIGTTTPANPLAVVGSASVMGGNLGIGTTTPANPLTVVGSANIGSSNVVTGSNSLALGSSSTASGTRSFAQGGSALASGNESVAIGSSAKATNIGAIAIGSLTEASGQDSKAIGVNTTASGIASLAIGYKTIAGDWAIAIGDQSNATGADAIALGYLVRASGLRSLATGVQTKATGQYSTAMGRGIEAAGNYSFAIALNDAAGIVVNQNNALAIMGGNVGIGTTAPAAMLDIETETGAAAAIGSSGVGATGLYAVGLGENTVAGGKASLATGGNSIAIGNYSTAIGSGAVASGLVSTAIGSDVRAQGTYSVAIGRANIARGQDSVAIGTGIEAGAANTIAIALNDQTGTNITQPNTLAIMGGDVGIGTAYPGAKIDIETETGAAAAIGSSGVGATGLYAVGLGQDTVAGGKASLATGGNTIAFGNYSTALGSGTVAYGVASTAMGSSTQARGVNSVAMGQGSIARGQDSVAIGVGIEAGAANTFAIALNDQTGTNITQANTLAIVGGNVGIGTSAPATTLHVVGDVTLGNNYSGDLMIWRNYKLVSPSASNPIYYVSSNGEVPYTCSVFCTAIGDTCTNAARVTTLLASPTCATNDANDKYCRC